VPVRATSIAAILALAAGLLGCNRSHSPPTLVVSSDVNAAIAVAAFGDDARVEVQNEPQNGDRLLAQLAPIPFGEGPQWLAPPEPTGDAPYTGQDDPSFWLDPDRVVQAARSIALSAELDEAAQQRTDERLAALRETMMRADEQVQALLLGLTENQRVVATDSIRLGYFAERYGLQILPVDGAGVLGDLDLDHLGPPGSPTATLDGLIVEVARRVASPGS
jgi:ABC-type Zn uptake system ZnuABC Zn-binding protein ZnuA